MAFGFRKSKKVGPFRFTLTNKGVSGSAGAGPVRVGRSSTGRRSKSINFGKGFSWRTSRKKR